MKRVYPLYSIIVILFKNSFHSYFHIRVKSENATINSTTTNMVKFENVCHILFQSKQSGMNCILYTTCTCDVRKIDFSTFQTFYQSLEMYLEDKVPPMKDRYGPWNQSLFSCGPLCLTIEIINNFLSSLHTCQVKVKYIYIYIKIFYLALLSSVGGTMSRRRGWTNSNILPCRPRQT